MPREFGKVDASVDWACASCSRKHAPGSACPPIGVWLVLALCRACDPKVERYCSRHRDRYVLPTAAPADGPLAEEGAA